MIGPVVLDWVEHSQVAEEGGPAAEVMVLFVGEEAPEVVEVVVYRL